MEFHPKRCVREVVWRVLLPSMIKHSVQFVMLNTVTGVMKFSSLTPAARLATSNNSKVLYRVILLFRKTTETNREHFLSVTLIMHCVTSKPCPSLLPNPVRGATS